MVFHKKLNKIRMRFVTAIKAEYFSNLKVIAEKLFLLSYYKYFHSYTLDF